jgi:NAD(P)-dependent dehydrogenase (short-subunit alcohol dehydrogenase family)
MGTAQDIATAIVFLASDESSFITSAELVIDGSYSAAEPRSALPRPTAPQSKAID